MGTRFELGQVVATPSALEALEISGVSSLDLLARYQSGDWGEVPPEDAKENERSVRSGYRVVGSYAAGEERI